MTPRSRAAATIPSTSVPSEAQRGPLEKLREFLEAEGMKSKTGPRSFADFEQELHERMMKAERDIVAAEMAKLDADAIVIEGKVHRRVLRQSQTYETSAGSGYGGSFARDYAGRNGRGRRRRRGGWAGRDAWQVDQG